ncbi:hypothetical protein [Sneathiella limimaris]|uniref:hypothetical protein n=1 Tax=Sneathiella limimaris TaxID=1964213 RepID=UPI00146F0664|nr:hypothetical protein [Sneathiella limimaris]
MNADIAQESQSDPGLLETNGWAGKFIAYTFLWLALVLSVSSIFVDLEFTFFANRQELDAFYSISRSLIFNSTIPAFIFVVLIMLNSIFAFFGKTVAVLLISVCLLIFSIFALAPITDQFSFFNGVCSILLVGVILFLLTSLVRKRQRRWEASLFDDDPFELYTHEPIQFVGRSRSTSIGGDSTDNEKLEKLQKSLHEFARAATFNLARFQRWRVATHLFPDDEVAQINLARVLMEMRKYETALDLWYPLFNKYPDRGNYWQAVVMCLINLNRFDEAERMIKTAKNDEAKAQHLDQVKMAFEKQLDQEQAKDQ